MSKEAFHNEVGGPNLRAIAALRRVMGEVKARGQDLVIHYDDNGWAASMGTVSAGPLDDVAEVIIALDAKL